MRNIPDVKACSYTPTYRSLLTSMIPTALQQYSNL